MKVCIFLLLNDAVNCNGNVKQCNVQIIRGHKGS